MSYLQEAQLPTARVERAERQPSVLPARVALPLLMLLAFFHGALYAAFLPPWGLIDEAQHLHYIQYIAEQQALPVAGEVYLSDEIVASLFATRRWETFHWTPPTAADPQAMGLEGHSYEAYQPPLFYLLMAPVYLVLPDAMLVKVYALRGVVVLLSLVTVWATYRTAQTLLPRVPAFPFWAGLLLVAIPERAMATSRINNDVLLEVVAALFMLALTRGLVAGLTTRRSVLLGLLLGLAVWVKISAGVLAVPLLMLFWLRQHDASMRDAAMPRHFAWAAIAAAPFAITLALRNLWLYGDLTGFGSFDQLHRLAPTDVSLAGIMQSLISVPNHFWLVWWKGADAGQNGLLTLFYALMFVVVVVAWARLGLAFWQQWQAMDRPAFFRDVEAPGAAALAAKGTGIGHDTTSGRAPVDLVYAVTVLLYALAVVSSYYEGMVPVIQGRFMLPAVVPFVLLLVWGLWLMRHGAAILLAVVIVLWGMGLLSLFGNLIPYYYYWSGVLTGVMPSISESSMGELLALVYQRVMFDKPAFLSPLLLILPVCYGAMLLAALFVTQSFVARKTMVEPAMIPAGASATSSSSQSTRPSDV
jgi:hypothetical protein